MDAMTFLDKGRRQAARPPLYALVGDDDFLKARCREAVIAQAVGDADPAFAVASHGDRADWADVRGDLDTRPFLAPARVVVVEPADGFVTAHRDKLERYAAAPSPVGVLVLDLKSLPANTKLAKGLPDAGKVECKAPAAARLAGWCRDWAAGRHAARLDADAADLLVQLVGPSLGLLDQEIAKLATAVGPGRPVRADDVARLVARARAADVFRILDAVADGDPAAALSILADLLADGEDPFKLLGALTAQLRKLAAVRRHQARGAGLGPALDAAGVNPYFRVGVEKQLRRLGRRADRLSERTAEVNAGFRGGSPLPLRLQLERLIVDLARPAAVLAAAPAGAWLL